MKYLHSFVSAVVRLWRTRDELRLSNIRLIQSKYALSYVIASVVYNMRTYLYADDILFGLHIFTLTYLIYSLATLVVTFLWPRKSILLTRCSAILMLAGFILWMVLPNSEIRLGLSLICWLGLGGCAAATRYGFAYGANNAERLIGAISILFFYGVFHILDALGIQNIFLSLILPAILIVGLFFPINSFRQEELKAREETPKDDRRSVYFAVAYMIAFYTIDAFLTNCIPIDPQNNLIFGIGSVVSVILFFVVYLLFKKGLWHIWSLFFLFALGAAVFALFPSNPVTKGTGAFLNGLRCIGLPATLYMLGGVQKKFASISMYKKSTLLIILFVPVSVIISDTLVVNMPVLVPTVSIIAIVGIFIGFMMLSPLTSKYLFNADWMDDYHRSDMSPAGQHLQSLKEAGTPIPEDLFDNFINKVGTLTRTERELFRCYQDGKGTQEILACMYISLSTLKTHNAHIFEKLGVSSRDELILYIELIRKSGKACEIEV